MDGAGGVVFAVNSKSVLFRLEVFAQSHIGERGLT